MSDLTLPEVRRCLQRIVVFIDDGEPAGAQVEARLALHLLSAWTERDLEVAMRAMRVTIKDKGRATPRKVLDALDPQRARKGAQAPTQ
ncbi:unannotated protein [freshwater metagenome]|uniref:Unannotated protein n=1 Tax=freshwater metagenome TaxID=449393 RepID=A0A6J7I1R5_9ZZZZ|nr:hypothetical protein [Actinomycetota bacterium]